MKNVHNPFEYLGSVSDRELTAEERQEALGAFAELFDDLVLAYMQQSHTGTLLFGGREMVVAARVPVGDEQYLAIRLIQSEVPDTFRLPDRQIDIYEIEIDGVYVNGVSYRTGPGLPVYRHDDPGMDFDLPRKPLSEEIDNEHLNAELARVMTLNDRPVDADEVQKVRALLLGE